MERFPEFTARAFAAREEAEWWRGQSPASGAERVGSIAHHLLAVKPWTSYLVSLG